MNNLRNKRILITAGPTWVAIDKVRVISNTATGKTGVLLAEKLADLGARVTLLLGPVEFCGLNKNIRVIRFRFFDELKNKISRELKAKRYAALIHSAAVSDYLPVKIFPGKVKSGLRKWKVVFKPAPKLIDAIKRTDRGLFLVGFKFEPDTVKNGLISGARALMGRARLNLAVANTLNRGRYRAYILSGDKIGPLLISKEELAAQLVERIKKLL